MHTRGRGARLEASVAVAAAAAARPSDGKRARGRYDPDLGKDREARSLRSGSPTGEAVGKDRPIIYVGVGASVPSARVPAAGMEANDTLVQAPDPNLLCPICINVLDNPLRTPCG